jgi:lysophospholipase L1-like esterase
MKILKFRSGTRHFTGLASAIIILPFLLWIQAPDSDPITVYLIGDSTMSVKEDRARPETGWGMPFAGYFDSTVRVENHARNGRSTKTFFEENLWQPVYENLKPGDYVFIQFGHNDEAPQKASYTPPDEYRNLLSRYVSETREKGGIAVLLTPVTRRRFDDSGNIRDTHTEYSGLMREVARAHDVYLIDMDEKSKALLQSYGQTESAKLFLQLEPGEHPNYPDGVIDNTHFNEYGARKIADLVAEGINELNLELAGSFVEDIKSRNE